MINIAKFDTDFYGRKVVVGNGATGLIVGYGDNGDNGNPYFVVALADGTVKTHLIKSVTLTPLTQPSTV